MDANSDLNGRISVYDLKRDLPFLIPKAISWVQQCEREILQSGLSLNPYGRAIATRVGVQRPENIRVVLLDADLPLPADVGLRDAGIKLGLFGPHMDGITMGYGIYIRRSENTTRLLSHELRHVYQYEQAGSITTFIEEYLSQVALVGYSDAPYEKDACAHECDT
jgi:hypothetical protein